MSVDPYPYEYPFLRKPGFGGRDFNKVLRESFTGFVVRCDATACVIKFKEELSAGEVTLLTSEVNGFSNLTDLKAQRKEQIDTRTRALIDVAQTTGVGTVTTITLNAVTLRSSLDAATTEAELDAVVDSR